MKYKDYIEYCGLIEDNILCKHCYKCKYKIDDHKEGMQYNTIKIHQTMEVGTPTSKKQIISSSIAIHFHRNCFVDIAGKEWSYIEFEDDD